MSNGLVILVCMPATCRVLIESEKRRCEACDCEVWVAPSSVAQLQKQPHIRIVCSSPTCIAKVNGGRSIKAVAPCPGSEDEVAAAMRPKERN